MSIFVVCGSPWSRTEAIFRLLEDQGVQPAIAATGQRGLSLDALLNRLVPDQIEGPRDPSEIRPGRIYEQAAGDILIANWAHPHWGFADPRSLWILDFLRGLDQNIRIILVHEHPEQAIARAILETGRPLDLERMVASWFTYERAMLRFYLRNPADSLLIDAETVLRHPEVLFEQLGGMTDLHLEAPETSTAPLSGVSPLAQLIARTLLENHPEALRFNQEIESSLSGLAPERAVEVDEEAPSALTPVEDLRQLLADRASMGAKLHELEALLERARKEHEQREQTKQKIIADLELQHQQLIADRASAEAQSNDLKAQLERTRKEHEQLEQAKQKALSDRVSLEQQLIEAKARAQSLAETAPAAATDTAALAEAERSRFREQEEGYQRRLKEEAEENELLLAQLHQVQEELEHYFLKFQDSRQSEKRLKDQVQRLFDKDPALYDLESLTLLEKEGAGADFTTKWRLHGVAAAGRLLETIEVSLIRRAGHPILGIHRSASEDPLIRWPSETHEKEVLEIQFEGPEETRLSRFSTLFALSGSDWVLIKRLCDALSEEFGKWVDTGGSRIDRNELLEALGIVQAIGQALHQFPEIWRYGTITLKSRQINPDYAHLWFSLKPARLGDQAWPSFEFRLSAAHTHQGTFGDFPKLEFPEVSGQAPQFEGWFEESLDDFGPKFELRFNRKAGEVDRSVLDRLSETDQGLLKQIAAGLPEMLTHLAQAGEDLGRPLGDWQEAATAILKILHQPQQPPLEESQTPRQAPARPPRRPRVQKQAEPQPQEPRPSPRKRTRKRAT